MRLYLQEQYDALENCSTLSLTGMAMKCSHRNGRFYYNGSISIDGVPIWSSSGGTHQSYHNSTGTWYSELYGSYPYTSDVIYHDDDGSKTVTLTANIYGTSSTGFSYSCSVSQSLTLTAIPRASTVSAPNGVIGSAVTISVSRKSTAYTHTLTYAFGSASGTIVSGSTASVISWTPPLALCSQIPKTASGTCAITCETYSGSTLIGTKTCTVTLTVPSSVGLTVSDGWAVAAPYNEGAVSGFGSYVQGYSKAQVTFDSSKISTANAYGATIASYSIEQNGSTIGSPYRTGVLGTAGAQSIVCTVTDTRGRTVSQTLTITVEAYAKPTLSDISIFRCTSKGAAADDGTYLSVTAKANISSVDGENSMTMTAAVRTIGGSYGDEKAVESGKTAVLFDGLVSAVQTYEVRITLTDRLGNTSVFTMVIPTANAFFNGRAGGSGAAFGKYAEEDDLLEVVWNLKTKKNLTAEGGASIAGTVTAGSLTVNGKTLLDRTYPVGAIYISTESTSPASLFGGTWARIKDRFLLGAGDTYAALTMGGEANVTLTEAQIPSHQHWIGSGFFSGVGSYGVTGSMLKSASTPSQANANASWNKVQATGGGGAHNNMPPYSAVYIWKRTA